MDDEWEHGEFEYGNIMLECDEGRDSSGCDGMISESDDVFEMGLICMWYVACDSSRSRSLR